MWLKEPAPSWLFPPSHKNETLDFLEREIAARVTVIITQVAQNVQESFSEAQFSDQSETIGTA